MELKWWNENSALLPLQKNRNFVNYENQGGRELSHTNQTIRIAGNNNRTWCYTIWSNVLGVKVVLREFCTFTVAEKNWGLLKMIEINWGDSATC